MPQAIIRAAAWRRQIFARDPAAWAKYGFDVGLILLLSPVLLVILVLAVLLVALQGGRIFYGHDRIGRNGQSFRMWKFRTMVPDAERRLMEHLRNAPDARREWAENRKLRDDPRITPIGRFLRQTSMDELPQLWNVLRGEMSLVGPRPVPRSELQGKYRDCAGPYLARRPGLTGIWQVSGRNRLSYAERIEMDALYHLEQSMWLDLRILARTVAVIARRDGW